MTSGPRRAYGWMQSGVRVTAAPPRLALHSQKVSTGEQRQSRASSQPYSTLSLVWKLFPAAGRNWEIKGNLHNYLQSQWQAPHRVSIRPVFQMNLTGICKEQRQARRSLYKTWRETNRTGCNVHAVGLWAPDKNCPPAPDNLSGTLDLSLPTWEREIIMRTPHKPVWQTARLTIQVNKAETGKEKLICPGALRGISPFLKHIKMRYVVCHKSNQPFFLCTGTSRRARVRTGLLRG